MFKIGEIVFVPAAQGGLRVAKIEELDTRGKVARVFWHENSVKRRKEVKFEHIQQVAASISASETVSNLWEASQAKNSQAYLTEVPGVKSEQDSDIRSDIKSQVRIQAETQVRAQAEYQVRAQVENQVRAQVENQVRAQFEGLVRAEISAHMRSLAEAQSRVQAEALEREFGARSTPSSVPPVVRPSAPPAPVATTESSDEEFYPPDVDLDHSDLLDRSVNVGRTRTTRPFTRRLVGIMFFCAVLLLAGKLVRNFSY
jgi:hypothetical protein